MDDLNPMIHTCPEELWALSSTEKTNGTSLAYWFSTFCSNIQVQDGGTISTRHQAITRQPGSSLLDDAIVETEVGWSNRWLAGRYSGVPVHREL